MPPEHFRRADQRPRITPQLFVGLVVIAIGILMTFDNLGLVHAEEYIRFWPASLIGVGLLKLWYSREGLGGAFGGFIFTVAGAWLLLEQMAVVHVSFWDMWPTLLVFFGGFLVWQGLSGPRRHVAAVARPQMFSDTTSPLSSDTTAQVPSDTSSQVSVDTNSTVSEMAVLGAVARGNNSSAFRGGELTAVMGGCELDLRQAAINGEAVIEVFGLWGGIEIRVPEDWTVVSRVVPVLGGVDDKTRPPQGASRHRLVLRGFIVMAGVEVKN
jgi:predicted membrane protein